MRWPRLQYLILVLLSFFGAAAGRGEQPAPPPQDQFFSGTITALTADRVTVSRTVLGKESTVRTFAITPDTRIEGKPRLKARVTVRFVRGDEGDLAVHIIVRTGQKK